MHVLAEDAGDGEALGVVPVANEDADAGVTCAEEAEELLKRLCCAVSQEPPRDVVDGPRVGAEEDGDEGEVKHVRTRRVVHIHNVDPHAPRDELPVDKEHRLKNVVVCQVEFGVPQG